VLRGCGLDHGPTLGCTYQLDSCMVDVKMIIEVTYFSGDKKIFIVDENILVVNLAKLLNSYGGAVKKLEFV
jgi:hypothetical protein